MVVKGPSSGQDIYDTPASTDKNTQQTVRLWKFKIRSMTILLQLQLLYTNISEAVIV